MTASKEVAAPKELSGTEVEGFDSADLDQINAQIKSQTKKADIVLPRIAVGQGLSAAVQDGNVKPGEFYNTLTGEVYGSEFEFIVAFHFYGNQFSDRDKNFFGSTASPRIPTNWPHKDAGKLFEESDDYEDRFKELVNKGEREWGSGPPISTTYNFVGYIPGDHSIPLRLSLSRTSSGAAKKLLTLISTDQRIWGHTYKVASRKEEAEGNRYYVVDLVRGENTPNSDLKPIVDLAVNMVRADASDFNLAGDDSEKQDTKKAAASSASDGLDL